VVRDDLSQMPCSFCDAEESAQLEEVLALILDGLHAEYDDPNNGVSWESAEGGWLGVEGRLWDTEELLYSYLECEENVMQSIVGLTNQEQWVYRDPYGAREHEELYWSWELFADIVKHKARYVFFRSDEIKDAYDSLRVNPLSILDELGRIVLDIGLVEELAVGFQVMRARCAGSRTFSTSAELGPPPIEKARSSRMSPYGIQMFYCANDEETCCLETVTWDSALVTVAEWQSKRRMKVLNLSNLPEIPSIFDATRRDSRMPLIFLDDFVADFCKKIERDEREHIEYVPTQVVTEYFRRVFRANDGAKIDGIVYKSSLGPGNCYVFFFGQDELCNVRESVGEPAFDLQVPTIRTFRYTRKRP
ncbi:MAG: HEPN-associated N-terminal domain-containing protein, partial [Humidesulfovibrio sp.]|nr:HEPN-associated N-terminal domain-containing protein [Humidesulfovibrio sp.]